MSLCQNCWRKHGQPQHCELPAIGRYLVTASSQYPPPPMAEREGLGQNFVQRNLCGPCAAFISTYMVGPVQ